MTALTVLAVSSEPLLRAIAADPDASSKRLAEASGKKVNNLARDLDVLANAGLIVRHPPRLTPAGVDALAAIDRAAANPPPSGEGDRAPEGAIRLRHDQIKPDAQNDRRVFDPAELAILADSLFSSGLQQPPKVLPAGPDGLHELVMGERRWRAWGLLVEDGRWGADHTELCPIMASSGAGMDDLARREAALAENAARVDLSHIEYAHAFERLASEYGRSNKQIAATIGRTPEFVQQHRRLVKLSHNEQGLVAAGKLSFHEALQSLRRSINALDPELRLASAEIAAAVLRQHGELAAYNVVPTQPVPEAAMEALKELFQFSASHYETGLPSVAPWYGTEAKLKNAFPWVWLRNETPSLPSIDAGLAALRESLGLTALGADGYATPWLNGPFAPSAEKAAEIAKRQQDRAETEARWAREREAREAERLADREAEMRILAAVRAHARQVEAQLQDPPAFAPFKAAFLGATKAAAHPLPWRWADEWGVLDANDDQVDLDDVLASELGRLLVCAMNAAGGVAVAEPVLESDADDDDEADNPPPQGEGDPEGVEGAAAPAIACRDGARAGPLAQMLGDDFAQQLRAVRGDV